TAYNETCAAIGNVWWNHRLFLLEGDVKYFDVIERTLFNGLISGLSLSGTEFFYPNALESDGQYKFNQGSCTRKSWFDCSCCPTNLIRFLPSLPGLIYATRMDTLYVNLYSASEADIEMPDGKVSVTQTTEYPWDGRINIAIDPEKEGEFTVRLRIPGWARNEVLPGNLYQYDDNLTPQWSVAVNGESVPASAPDGYVTLRRAWRAGDNITLNFDMRVRRVIADDRVEEDRGKVALEYGPLVYAVEEADNPDLDKLVAAPDASYAVDTRDNLLGGIKVITAEGDNRRLVAIPYYAWSNRGIGKMKVWLPSTL